MYVNTGTHMAFPAKLPIARRELRATMSSVGKPWHRNCSAAFMRRFLDVIQKPADLE